MAAASHDRVPELSVEVSGGGRALPSLASPSPKIKSQVTATCTKQTNDRAKRCAFREHDMRPGSPSCGSLEALELFSNARRLKHP
eukprot:2520444-Pyramimonas_sp.AAC.1